MRLDDLEQSENVEDRRGAALPGGGIAVGSGATLLIAVVVMLLGGDPRQVLSAGSQIAPPPTRAQSNGQVGIEDDDKKFIAKILKETENVWTEVFDEKGKRYVKPRLVLFSQQVSTGCGVADSGVGPFYCPADSQVYIDPTFYVLMRDRLKAGGDFAKAYVIAHEVGHHVQYLLGISRQVESARRQLSERQANALSVRMELQADYFAGVWANRAGTLQIDRKDIEEAVNAANQIGDDTLQRSAGQRINPSAFTHGTSAQRVRWFMKGYQTGTLDGGDTFNASQL